MADNNKKMQDREEKTRKMQENIEKGRPVFYENPHEKSRIDKLIAVMSGKGGVGKSTVTSLAALAMEKSGWNAAILDADITGPSIPKAFGLSKGLEMLDGVAHARESNSGIQIVSTNLILERDVEPVIWKGPMVGMAVKQFWTDIVYSNVDYMFVDMPPGTGDVPLTVFQTLPLDGVILVTSPQDLVSMIVEKAMNMCLMMGIPIIGVIENMSYFKAPDTGKEYKIFGESHIEEICREKKLDLLARLPINPGITQLMDKGRIEEADVGPFKKLVDKLEELKAKNK